MIGVRDEETQRNGTVVVCYKIGHQYGHQPSRLLLFQGAGMQHGLPARLNGIHACFERSSLPFLRILKYALEGWASRRVRIHEGGINMNY